MLPLRIYKSISVRDLTKFESNSRTHSDEQIAKIVRSIKEFGFTNPLLVDENNVIIAGHGRLAAAEICGIDDLPCIVLEGLSDAQKAALVIADNKIAVDAGWDNDMLVNQFEYLKGFDYDLTLTGFDLDELGDIFPEGVPEVFCGDDDLPVVAETRSKLGDLWILGDHRLLCGDSTVASDVDRILDGQMPNTMVTDPPYGVKLDMSWRNEARGGKNNENVVQNDDRADWFDAYVLFPGAVAYVWHADRFTDVVMDGLRRSGFEVKQQIIWNKNVHALSRSDYHWKHEPCWYAVKKGAKSNWKGDRKQTTVWDCASPNASSSGSKDDKTDHPTQKPVELFERSVAHHTNPGEYVYDPFAGSGTLMIACEKIKRRALMMELDCKYADMIIQRYENYSGKQAVRED